MRSGQVRCWTCNGNGVIHYPRCKPVPCPDCKGKGRDEAKTKLYIKG